MEKSRRKKEKSRSFSFVYPRGEPYIGTILGKTAHASRWPNGTKRERERLTQMLAFRPIGERKLESEQSIDKALLGRGVTARGRVFSFFPYLSPAVCRFFYLCNVNARPLPNLQTITRENELFFKRNSVPVIFLSSQTKLNQRGYIEWGVDVENFFILSLFEKAFRHSPIRTPRVEKLGEEGFVSPRSCIIYPCSDSSPRQTEIERCRSIPSFEFSRRSMKSDLDGFRIGREKIGVINADDFIIIIITYLPIIRIN